VFIYRAINEMCRARAGVCVIVVVVKIQVARNR